MRVRLALVTALLVLIACAATVVVAVDEMQSVSNTEYIVLTPPVQLQPGDVLAPHLFDWYFDGVDDYLVVGLQPGGVGTPFTVYGWSEITISERIHPVWPKANTAWSRTGMIGDPWNDYPSTEFVTDNRYDYTYFGFRFRTRRADGTMASYPYNIVTFNVWHHLVRRFTASRELSYWVNGSRVYAATVPSTEITVLERNPDAATYPYRYRRFTLGANVHFTEHMTLYQSYLIIHSRALNDSEIQALYSGGVVDANGLEIFIDATFTNGTHYFNLGRNPATVGAYNGVLRVPASRTWLWVIRGASADPVVWLRFFPAGSLVVFSDGSTVVVEGEVNAVGLVEEFAVSRTDIVEVMIPVLEVTVVAPKYYSQDLSIGIRAWSFYTDVANITLKTFDSYVVLDQYGVVEVYGSTLLVSNYTVNAWGRSVDVSVSLFLAENREVTVEVQSYDGWSTSVSLTFTEPTALIPIPGAADAADQQAPSTAAPSASVLNAVNPLLMFTVTLTAVSMLISVIAAVFKQAQKAAKQK